LIDSKDTLNTTVPKPQSLVLFATLESKTKLRINMYRNAFLLFKYPIPK